MKMKLAAAVLFIVTGIIILWQCSDMISPLRRAGAGPAVMLVLWLPTLALMAAGLGALAEVRGQVADLALLAAGKVVGETMSSDRERRLVDEFLAQATVPGPASAANN